MEIRSDMAVPGPGAGRFRIADRLPPDLCAQAAVLYWQAFGSKLGRVMGPEVRAVAYLTRVIDPAHAVAALAPDGQLMGILGFKSPAGAFADGHLHDLAVGFGWPGALWRAGALSLLTHEVDNRRFLVDGIAVARGYRGLGVGTAMIRRAGLLAARRGYAEMRLDVVDTNLRARALYERLGFRPAGVSRLGLLRHVFGFDSAITMVCAV